MESGKLKMKALAFGKGSLVRGASYMVEGRKGKKGMSCLSTHEKSVRKFFLFFWY
jgi:hypothetical protein